MSDYEKENKITIWMSSKHLNAQVKGLEVKIEFFTDLKEEKMNMKPAIS